MTAWIISVAAAATLVAAWWYPSTTLCAALGWSSVALFVVALSIAERRLLRMFVAGLITYTGGFFWLYSTISDFGGFPFVAAAPIFALYVVGSAVQFLILAFVWPLLPAWCGRWGLRTALAWIVAHHFWIKIFPWDFGHTQIAFTPLAQLAGVTGVTGITATMMWVSESLCTRRIVAAPARVVSLMALVSSIAYGFWVHEKISTLSAPSVRTVLIQGNVSLLRKHDVTYFTVNRKQYLQTSALTSERDSLIIWPESTITDFIPATVSHATEAPILPFLNNGSAFLVGGITLKEHNIFHNSSILVRPDGSVAPPYHKMILMPFGEYTPLSSWLPWLADINSTAAQFTPGDSPSVLSFSLSNGTKVSVAPLICYEDVVPNLAREATARGAGVLVNQTNDAWFGDTIAPYQHHMIASFRAIENRRFLLRSTNTGLTAVVDPLGRTLASLLPFTESVLPMEITLLQYNSVWTMFPVYLVWLAIAAITLFATVIRAARATRW